MPALSAEDYTVSHQRFDIWECKNCTLRFTQNVPGQAEIGPYYQSENYISHSNTREGFINRLYHQVRKRTLNQKRKLVEKQTSKTSGSILDVGCGTGAFLHTMDTAGWRTTGVEPDESARKKALELYELQLSDPQELFRLPAAGFDAITMWHVLEHVHELHAYIRKIKELLKPAGKLFIAVPNYTSYDQQMYKEFWAAYDVPRHLYHFSPRCMNILLSTYGLQVTKIKPMWYDSFYVSMLSERYQTGKPHYLRAITRGLVSNLKAVFHNDLCSSVIYVASARE